ncbi:hypothetical protein BDM02DRAFT_3066943, partial [Thelephora ganbajun]
VSDSDSDSDPDPGSGAGDSSVGEAETVTDESNEPVLSHAEKRRQKKRKLNSGDPIPVGVSEPPTESTSTSSKPKKGKEKKGKKAGDSFESGDALPKRQNSVWVGNLAYKTTAVALKNFFEGLEITRIHMPVKAPPSGTGPKVNSGFAYVDFSTPDAKLIAITLSERNLEGRRLLIKDGGDFNGRPTTATTATNEDGTATTTEATTSKSSTPKTGLTKTAQKILAVQKQPPGPTLFFGNLGFEVTEDSIRQLLEAHRKKPAEEDKWIRKIRMGTFEDSGKCKGWAFVDFSSAEHATAALTNPRNHTLDGRKLNVEYASPDAVRRGGGPREPHNNKHTAVKGGGRPGKRKVKEHKSAGHVKETPKSAAVRSTEDGERKLERKLKHDFGVERASWRGERPKPGAALALAQRGTAAILPSQGQKITF